MSYVQEVNFTLPENVSKFEKLNEDTLNHLSEINKYKLSVLPVTQAPFKHDMLKCSMKDENGNDIRIEIYYLFGKCFGENGRVKDRFIYSMITHDSKTDKFRDFHCLHHDDDTLDNRMSFFKFIIGYLYVSNE